MSSMAMQSQVCGRELIERKLWTSAGWREISVFIVQSVGLVCAAIFLYSLGPALGMTLTAVSVAVWLFLRSQIASDEEDGLDEDGLDEDRRHAGTVYSPSNCANPAWLRNGRLGMCVESATRSVQRQGA